MITCLVWAKLSWTPLVVALNPLPLRLLWEKFPIICTFWMPLLTDLPRALHPPNIWWKVGTVPWVINSRFFISIGTTIIKEAVSVLFTTQVTTTEKTSTRGVWTVTWTSTTQDTRVPVMLAATWAIRDAEENPLTPLKEKSRTWRNRLRCRPPVKLVEVPV